MDYDDDPNERPTLPNPNPTPPASTPASRAAAMRAFDTQAETFFSLSLALDGSGAALADGDGDELAVWWVDQRRRTLVGWVAAAMAVCAGVLALGFLVAPV